MKNPVLKKGWAAILFLLCTDTKAIAQVKKSVYAGTGFYKEIDFSNSYLTTVDIGLTFHLGRWFVASPEVDIYKFWNRDYS